MGRIPRQGMLYFQLDVDFFQDMKIRKILRACGPQSISIVIWLLASIFRDKGYYVGWTSEIPFLIADDIGVSDGAVLETVRKAVHVGFFDAGMLDSHSILTSHGIQARFFEMAKRKTIVKYDSRYLLTDVSGYPNAVDINPENSCNKKADFCNKNNGNNCNKNSDNCNKNNFCNNNSDICNEIYEEGLNNCYSNSDSCNKKADSCYKNPTKEKERIEDPATTTRARAQNGYGEVVQCYQNNIRPICSEIESQKLYDMVEHYGKDAVLKAIERAVLRGGRTLSYINGILQSWEQHGYDEEAEHGNKDRTNAARRRNGKPVRRENSAVKGGVRTDWSDVPDGWV